MMMHDHQRPLSGPHTGFTLLELLVVLVIVGMTSTFVGPQLWQSYDKAQERAAVQSWVEALNKMRLQAFHTGKPIRFSTRNHAQLPALPSGWELQSLTDIYFLPTGVSNGGDVELRADSGRLWHVSLRPLDAKATIDSGESHARP